VAAGANRLHEILFSQWGEGEFPQRRWIFILQKPLEEPADHFIYDPEHPVPTHGGAILFAEPGALDQRGIENRDDVLVFTSQALTEELEVTGHIKVILYAATDSKDTDWTAKLLDVYPDGSAFNLCDGVIRARYHKDHLKPQLISPHKIYKYEIDLWATSNVFLPGHKIRVEISSSNFPRFDRNPNTGNTFGMDDEKKIAKQSIYHSQKYPSHIVLPVIPGSD
jgi:putative CocE/NonD family hydrolase